MNEQQLLARIAELEGDLKECQSSNRQAWDICDGVAAALGDDLDRELGSAISVVLLQERLKKQRSPLLPGTEFMVSMDSLLRQAEAFEGGKISTETIREFILQRQPKSE